MPPSAPSREESDRRNYVRYIHNSIQQHRTLRGCRDGAVNLITIARMLAKQTNPKIENICGINSRAKLKHKHTPKHRAIRWARGILNAIHKRCISDGDLFRIYSMIIGARIVRQLKCENMYTARAKHARVRTEIGYTPPPHRLCLSLFAVILWTAPHLCATVRHFLAVWMSILCCRVCVCESLTHCGTLVLTTLRTRLPSLATIQ